MDTRKWVERYFQAEEAGHVDWIVAACSEDVVIYDAGQPPSRGPAGVRTRLTEFLDRTSSRKFEVLAVAAENNVVYAWWQARLTFRAGATFGPMTNKRSFDVTIPGIHRFLFNSSGQIRELDVAHETTTVMQHLMAPSD